LIWEKLWAFLQKYLREEAKLQVDFFKYQGLFCKNKRTSPDPSRPRARFDGREQATWPPSLSAVPLQIQYLSFFFPRSLEFGRCAAHAAVY
jgi:hypothetical protein